MMYKENRLIMLKIYMFLKDILIFCIDIGREHLQGDQTIFIFILHNFNRIDEVKYV